MTDNTTQDANDTVETDGGVKTEAYLDEEINIFKPATPFMRDHLRVIWLSFLAWILVVFGPTTAVMIEAEFLGSDLMTATTVFGGFPLHFFLTAIFTPLGALLLSVAYAMQRDRLDTKYDITHETEDEADSGTVAADGGNE
jgi:putative solute:sodium symporter small subunit